MIGSTRPLLAVGPQIIETYWSRLLAYAYVVCKRDSETENQIDVQFAKKARGASPPTIL